MKYLIIPACKLTWTVLAICTDILFLIVNFELVNTKVYVRESTKETFVRDIKTESTTIKKYRSYYGWIWYEKGQLIKTETKEYQIQRII